MKRKRYARLCDVSRVVFVSITLLAITGCARASKYEVRLEALRATRELEKPVALSLWLYTGASKKELTKVFVSGRISGTQWIVFEDAKSVRIPSAALSADETFDIRAALNPNRLGQPPDAVFYATVSLPFVLTDFDDDPGRVFVEAADGAPFELSLRFSAKGR